MVAKAPDLNVPLAWLHAKGTFKSGALQLSVKITLSFLEGQH